MISNAQGVGGSHAVHRQAEAACGYELAACERLEVCVIFIAVNGKTLMITELDDINHRVQQGSWHSTIGTRHHIINL